MLNSLDKLSKKLVTTLAGMFSINYVAYLVWTDTLDVTHKVEIYGMIIGSLGALAGVHQYLQTKIDKEIKKDG